MTPRAAFTIEAGDAADVMGARLRGGGAGARFAAVSIDSRTLRAGELFFALRGPKFDGHAFLAEAIARGAAGVVVGEADVADRLPPDLPAFEVADTLGALQALARHVRRRSGAHVVAITGSTGKTTTKEIAATLLETRHRTLRNRGNLNNHIGLPLSLMELTDGAEVAVLELGMNHAGEIRRLVSIADPDVRVWTNVGTAHLEFFGTPDAIADAKAEILEEARADTVLVFNADDARVASRAARFPGIPISFGIERPADVRAVVVDDAAFDGVRATVVTPAGPLRVDSALPGRGNLLNLLAAVAVATHFGVPTGAIAERVADLAPADHRGEVKRLRGDVTLVDDCYNSSPGALGQLLDTVSRDRSGRRRVAFLGEMLELGGASASLHAECGRAAAAAGLAAIVAVGGPPAAALAEAAVEAGVPRDAVWHVPTSEDAAAWAGQVVRPGDIVLVKGSRGVRMERVVEWLEAELG